MLESATIARPYARAAFELAGQGGQVAEWSEALGALGRIVSDRQFRPLINDPRLDAQQLERLILDILPATPPVPARNFIRVLIRSGRLGVAATLYEMFESLRVSAEAIARVKVTSAFPVQQEQRQHLQSVLGRRFAMRVQLSVETDAALIGGVVIRVDDTVIDSSVRGSLQKLHKLVVN